MRRAVCRCLRGRPSSSSRIRSITGTSGSSLGRSTGLLRRYPGGTEKRSIFATVFGSMPNSRAARRWLIPSTWQARRTRAYRSTTFIPHASRQPCRRKVTRRSVFAPPRLAYPAASVRDFRSAALTFCLTASAASLSATMGAPMKARCVATLAAPAGGASVSAK